MAKVLVTGGAGFIGSHLVRALAESGSQVCVLDDFSSGSRENLAGIESLEIIAADLRDASALNTALHGVQVVYHLAAFVSVPKSMQDPETCFSVNVAGTLGLFEAARRAGVRKVVLASSTAVYGDTRTFPTGEEVPASPLSPYALSKHVNELYARLYSQQLGLPVIPLRFFNIYGPRQRPDSEYAAAVPIFLDRLLKGKPFTIYGDGLQTRDFVYVRDVVKACMLAAVSDTAGEPINICTGREVTILELVERIRKFAPKPPRILYQPARAGDIYRSLGDPEKARAELDFQAQTSLADGLRETLEWMRSSRLAHD